MSSTVVRLNFQRLLLPQHQVQNVRRRRHRFCTRLPYQGRQADEADEADEGPEDSLCSP
jgi:hypothetical protein